MISRANVSFMGALVSIAIWGFCPPASAQTPRWQHPGVLVSEAQLDATRAAYQAGNPVIVSQVAKAQNSNYGSLTYTPAGPWPGGVEQCGSNSVPDFGCSDSDSDSDAAYVQALLWYITDNQAYAKNTIAILDAYSSGFKGYAGYTPGYPCPSASGCSNGPLQAAWDAEKWPRAAEIIRYGHGGRAGWSVSGIKDFSTMLANIFVPIIYNGAAKNGNWEMSMIDGMMGIAVFDEDSALLAHARAFWLQRVPAYFYYQPMDGDTQPPFPPGRAGSETWNGQLIFNPSTSGVSQETCRDLRHAEDGLASAIDAAEIDFLQGGSLYTAVTIDAEDRLVEAMNLMAGLEARGLPGKKITAPQDFCTGTGSTTLNQITLGVGTTYAIGYNAYHNRLNDPNLADDSGTTGLHGTANTYHWIQNGLLTQPLTGDQGNHMTLFEALTHTVQVCHAATHRLSNAPFTAQRAAFTAKLNATPSANDIDGVIALADGPQRDDPDLTVIVRFNRFGRIDASNGTRYSAASDIPYAGGTTYSFDFDVNMSAETYTLFVTPEGGTKTLVGQDYAFRHDGPRDDHGHDYRHHPATLDTLALYARRGSENVCSFNLPQGGN